jgi:hypothetical protein
MIDGAESSPTHTTINDAMFNQAENPNAIRATVFKSGAVQGFFTQKYQTKIRSDPKHRQSNSTVSFGKNAEATKSTV